MLFQVEMTVKLPPDMPAKQAADIKATEKTYSQELVSNLPLFSYMEISVKPLCRHPSSFREDDS